MASPVVSDASRVAKSEDSEEVMEVFGMLLVEAPNRAERGRWGEVQFGAREKAKE